MKIIAYYLPQFHPIKENNEWWGEGFTEWTNVAKAKPLFKGHEQPKIPAALGFYDLRLDQIREHQAELAREAGVYGFCYWHYWFGNGKLLLERPIQEVISSKKPDFPFCLGWANESWMAKIWNKDVSKGDKGRILIEQEYLGLDDYISHFNYIRPIISDRRYIRINNRPIFVIYKPFLFNDFKFFKEIWNKLIQESGIADSFFFIAHTVDEMEINKLKEFGYDAVNMMRLGAYRYDKECVRSNIIPLLKYKIFNMPLRLKYRKMIKYFFKESDKLNFVFPSIIPNWDHTPRSGKRGVVFEGSTPELFAKHAKAVIESVKEKDEEYQIIFLKSWNEWGEGNYMEPDLKFGKQYIETLGNIVKECTCK